MEEYLNKGIKEIISEFPETATILSEYNIGCVPCNVGSCPLKDIVEIHNLPGEEDEILYPWMDRGLSTTQVGELFAKFNEADSLIGKEIPEKYEGFISNLEQNVPPRRSGAFA